MAEENTSQEFRLKDIDEIRNYLIEKLNWNELISKKVCTTLNYIKHSLILIPTITGCVSVSAFASLVGILIGITSSAVGIKIYVITAAIKNYKTIIKIKKKKHDKTILLEKSELNSIEVWISKALIDAVISHDEVVLINNVLKEYNEMKEEIDNLKG